MTDKEEKLKVLVQEKLGKAVHTFSFLGAGFCNNAWYVKTANGFEYLVKQERLDREFTEQNDLVVEGRLLEHIHQNNPSLPVVKVAFVCENPKMYCYEFVHGTRMKDSWESASEDDRRAICESLGKFHSDLEGSITDTEAQDMGLRVDTSANIEVETQKRLGAFLNDANIPDTYKEIIRNVSKTFEQTKKDAVFGLSHNDSHHENILINDGKVAAVIDFGDAEYADIHAGLTRYIQDYPEYAEIVFESYEKHSRNILSRSRVVAHTILNAVKNIRARYNASGETGILESYLHYFEKFTGSPYQLLIRPTRQPD